MTLQAVGIIVSFGALVLGIFNFFQARRDRQRLLKVKIENGVVVGDKRQATRVITVKCVNIGLKTVTVEECGIILPDGHSRFAFNAVTLGTRLPAELSEGKSCSQLMPASEVARVIKQTGYGPKSRIRAYFRDDLDHCEMSKALTFDCEAWFTGKSELAPD